MVFEKLLKKIVFRSHATSESLISHLRKQGVEIGDNTCFFYPHNVHKMRLGHICSRSGLMCR